MQHSAKRHRSPSLDLQEDTVIFNVGGTLFEVLRFRIDTQPSTMLANLLADIGTDKQSSRPLFVDANPDRFQYILDWYRYGEMFMPSHCPIEALLRDCRFFMLPNNVKINSRIYAIDLLSTRSENCHEQLHTEVIAQWPKFKAYVDRLISETEQNIIKHGEHSGQVCADSGQGCAYEDEFCGEWLSPDQTVWQEFHIARLAYVDGQQCCGWIDEANICNTLRLRSAIVELRRFGFQTSIRQQGWDIYLKVGVPPCKSVASSQRVRIDGVEVLRNRSGGPACLAVVDAGASGRLGHHNTSWVRAA